MTFARAVQKIDNPPLSLRLTCGPSGPLCVTIHFPSYASADAERRYQIYRIFAHGDDVFNWYSTSCLPSVMLPMADSLSLGWEEWYANLTDPPEISPARADAWWVERWQRLRRRCADDESTDALVTFLRKVLVLDPALRPTAAAEVLQDPCHGSKLCQSIAASHNGRAFNSPQVYFPLPSFSSLLIISFWSAHSYDNVNSFSMCASSSALSHLFVYFYLSLIHKRGLTLPRIAFSMALILFPRFRRSDKTIPKMIAHLLRLFDSFLRHGRPSPLGLKRQLA